MALLLPESSASHIWRAIPNHTPHADTARWLLVGAALVSGIIAGGFALFGAWPVLPFAGLEIVALWAAFHHMTRHASDFEEIVLDKDALRITACISGKTTTTEFHSYWAQVHFIAATKPSAPSRVVIRSHGHELEIGRLLSGTQKQTLARTLQQQLQTNRQAISQKPNQPCIEEDS